MHKEKKNPTKVFVWLVVSQTSVHERGREEAKAAPTGPTGTRAC